MTIIVCLGYVVQLEVEYRTRLTLPKATHSEPPHLLKTRPLCGYHSLLALWFLAGEQNRWLDLCGIISVSDKL